MSRRKDRARARTPGLWIATNALPVTGGHPFYQRLNQVLDTHAFDACVEAQCAPFYAATVGRPSLLPGTYYRLLLIGDVEGIDSERGIAWRPADSLALRGVLGLDLDEAPPEHSTISRTRRLIDLETHRAVFTWILQVLATTDLVTGQTIGIDATTLEANAALRSSVRRDSGETSQEFLTRLAQASGIETPTRADLARVDRKRPKKGRNTDWRHPHDPDARITKMKDGRTHLAHKAEHAVDLETGAIVGVTVQGADQGDTTTIAETVTAAAEELEAVAVVTDGQTAVIDEVVADKGYHSNQVLVDLGALDLRTYIAEPNRGRRNWKKKTVARDAVYAHRRRIRGARGLAWQRRRSEHLERPNAHLYETGGLRRPHVRGHANILKRLLIQTSAFNVGLLMRTLIGVGTPRGLQGRLAAVWALVVALWTRVVDLWRHDHTPSGDHAPAGTPHHRFELFPVRAAEWALSPRAARLPIYLDYHATTPTNPRVVEAMLPYFTDRFGNPASRHHAFGWAARDAVEVARRQVADLIGCDPREVYFTSGATESNNLELRGVVGACGPGPAHVVTVATEHRAVLDPCRALQENGTRVTVVQPGSDGVVSIGDVERALTADTVLLSVMTANNEIGVLQPIAEIGTLAHERDILFHTDAAQAAGKVPVSVRDLGVDLVSLSAHKIYGPKGVGALYVRRRRPRIPLRPLVDGGGHERGLRSGTINVPGVVGFGRAAAICQDEIDTELTHTQALRDRLLSGLERRLSGIQVNGSAECRLPNNLNVSFGGLEGEILLVGMDDVAISSGAACTSANPEPSHVLRAIGVPDDLERASLRFGLGRWTTAEEIDYTVDKVSSLVTRLCQVSPLNSV